jgi:Glycosyl transferase family 2
VTNILQPREAPVDRTVDGTGDTAVELTVVLPCLNEAETLATCIRKAKASFASLGIAGEVLVADNGSTDGSREIARAEGARVVDVPVRGYGAALNHGFQAAGGRFVIMADADDSYALDDLGSFVTSLRGGADLVMGNRFAGGIAPGAMPALHRYLGNPVLSRLGRLFYKIPVGDFHCGMRGFRRDAVLGLGLRTTGMEFASEMVVRASLNRLIIREVPTTLRPDGRSRRPHLRTWRDGWRHLRFLLAFSPRWLLWYPALVLGAFGVFGLLWLLPGGHTVGSVTFGVHTMLAAATATIVAVQLGGLAVLCRAYAAALGLLPRPAAFARGVEQQLLAWGGPVGALLTLAGVSCFVAALVGWGQADFGRLDPAATMRLPIIGMVLILLGVQSVLLSFTLSLTRIGEL